MGKMVDLELLAPAGNWECLKAAVANGADAVYFGLPRFNARMRADNFSEEDLPNVMRYLHARGVRGFVAFNTLVFTDELEAAARELEVIRAAKVDAIIVQDIGLVQLARVIAPEVEVHASTQMTITSPEGVQFATSLGISRVVLARETSLRELAKFDPSVPIEVFVHGALCVAYSGQCLTSESLGQRSANRGECAQACRMPYELVVDGATVPLDGRHYLLSPQDLAAVHEVPELIRLGVKSFKIEGRLKSPEYVAAVTQVYRKAIDQAMTGANEAVTPEDYYQLEMTFSRGLFSGWMHGVDHQKLVPARFGKKRGPFAGTVTAVGKDYLEFTPEIPLAPGDGIAIDTGGDTNYEQGGRIYQIRHSRFYFKSNHIDFKKIPVGSRIWKTHDPHLEQKLRKSFVSEPPVKKSMGITMVLNGRPGQPLKIAASSVGQTVQVESGMVLEAARNYPLTAERVTEHLSKFSQSPYFLESLIFNIEEPSILPISELNRLRRQVQHQFETMQKTISVPDISRAEKCYSQFLEKISLDVPEENLETAVSKELNWGCLVRNQEQALAVASNPAVREVILDFEDIRLYKNCLEVIRALPTSPRTFLATPRIQKAGEAGYFKLLESAKPDGVLIRNLGAISYFQNSSLHKIGDFSLNVANPLSAAFFLHCGLERLTISYDLNISQVLSFIQKFPPHQLELTIHQHMPMFHMEHCVFAAFLSNGSDYTTCGRPCEKFDVQLRDRVGMLHPLKADVGCRNTLFNGKAQTGASFFQPLVQQGLRNFRIEFVNESVQDVQRVLESYISLSSHASPSTSFYKTINAVSQLGTTTGTLTF